MLTHALFDLPLGWLPAALLLALLVDRVWGEPPVKWHPVVWMGNYLGWAGERLQRIAQPWSAEGQASGATPPDWRSFWAGAVAWAVGVVLVLLAAVGLMQGLHYLADAGGAAGMGSGSAGMAGVDIGEVQTLPGWPDALAIVLLGLLLKPLLAWAMLRSEVLAVEAALSGTNAGAQPGAAGGSLQAGRERLSWLVSRDVSGLSESGVRESAIESLAENLSDSVIAPIFWFFVFGLPGAAVYRLANTADAMWGYRGTYRGKTWEWAGKWAARADDVLNWIPARLTAWVLWLARPAANVTQAAPSQRPGFSRVVAEAAQTPSPNSGWPMAAMALALGVSLRKPGVYVLNAAGQEPPPEATQQAVKLAGGAVVLFTVLLLVLSSLLACAGFGAGAVLTLSGGFA